MSNDETFALLNKKILNEKYDVKNCKSVMVKKSLSAHSL